jgi:hypothetical protein
MCQNVGTAKRNLFQTNRVFVPKIVLCVIQENCFCIEKLNKIEPVNYNPSQKIISDRVRYEGNLVRLLLDSQS